MSNNNRKKIQLYRNEEIYTPSAQQGLSALEVAKNDLASFSLSDGEVVIGRYQETNQNVKTVIAVAHDMSNNNEGMTFFTDSSDFVSRPVVLYQTDGTTGLLGVNEDELGNDWQLENYDFTPYKYLRCYFKMGNFSTTNPNLTPSMVIELPLEAASKSKSAPSGDGQACDMYVAGGVAPNPSDPTTVLSVLVAVDSTKTKFQVVYQNMYDGWQYDDNYSNSSAEANNNGRFLYKIEGCFDALNNASEIEYLEHDPIFTASPAYGITSSDIDNWNSMVGGGTITEIRMNDQTVGTSGIVDLGTVVTEETDPTVPSWAKASTKPSYTASEVGAVPTTRTVNGKELSSDISLTSTDVGAVPRSRTVNGKALTGNIILTAEDVGALPNDTVIPTKVSQLTNDSGFTTNEGTITGITMNGSSKGTSGVVDLGTVLTSHQDISGKADKSAAIGSLSLALDSTNYKITLSGTKVDGTSFTVSNVIDLPLESVVVNGSYNNTTKKVVLTLQNGSTVEFSVADLVAGLQSEITSTNKLSADLISDGTTNKVVTASDVTNWNSKTDNIGTITGITMNGSSKGTSGVVNLGTVVTEETDPTVPSWAKASTKPSYTASEVGAVPTTRTINSKALSGNITLTPEDIEAQPETFIVQCSTSGGNWVSDKTNAEIFTAYEEGKEIYVIVESDYIGMISGVPSQNNAVFTITPYDEPNVTEVFTISTNNNVQTVSVGTNEFLVSNPTKEKLWSQQQVWLSFTSESGVDPNTPITFYDGNGEAVSVSTVKDTFNDPSKNVILYDEFQYTCLYRYCEYVDTSITWTFTSVPELTDSYCAFYGVTFNYKASSDIIYIYKLPSFETISSKRLINGSQLNTNLLISNYTTQTNSSESAAITAAGTYFSTSFNGSIIAIKFKYNVPANATLNIFNRGAKPIYYRDSAITEGIINAGDIATFIYSAGVPQHFVLIANDAWINKLPTFTSSDNGKILGVVNGQLSWVTPTTIYTGNGTPSSSQGNDGDIYLQTS